MKKKYYAYNITEPHSSRIIITKNYEFQKGEFAMTDDIVIIGVD